MLLAAKRETVFPQLPWKDDSRNADHFGFNFETLLFYVPHVSIQLAAVIALGTALAAAGLIQKLTSRDLWCADHLRDHSQQHCGTDGRQE